MRLLANIVFFLYPFAFVACEGESIVQERFVYSDSCEMDDDCQENRWCVDQVCERPCYYQFATYGSPLCKAEGEKCENSWECETVFCKVGICTNSCGDGEQNGEEVGIDCGGSSVSRFGCDRCPNGTHCYLDGHCTSLWCRNGTCDNCRDSNDCLYSYECNHGQCQ